MARGLDWKLLVLMGCAACSSGGEDDMTLENGATSPGGTSGAPASTTTTSGSAGMRSTTAAAAGRSGSASTTMTGATASAGTKAAATSGSAGSTASAAGSGAAGTSASAAGSNAAGTSASASGTGGSAGKSGAAGTSGAAGGSSTNQAGSSGAAGSGNASESSFKRPCISDGNEVVFIGDSYSDYPIAHASLASFMQTIAIKDSALKQGDTYRNLAVAGTTLGDAATGIPSQWEGTKAMKPIKAVVMDGGGNDVLIDHQECRADGSEKVPGCMQVVQGSLDIIKKLLDSMKATGVSDVLFFWYPHIPGGALTGFETANTISDYTYPMIEDIAKAASTDTFHVYTIPTVDIFEGHPDWFYTDGLHANDTGEEQIAEAIWKVAKDNCIMQASGCCMP